MDLLLAAVVTNTDISKKHTLTSFPFSAMGWDSSSLLKSNNSTDQTYIACCTSIATAMNRGGVNTK